MANLMVRGAFLLAGATLLPAAAPAIAKVSRQPPIAAIKAENARWADAYARGDYEAIGRLYTAKAMLLPPSEDRVVGPAAIVAYFTKTFGHPAPGTIRFTNFEFFGDDAMVTEVSDAEIRDRTGKLTGRAKQTLVFIKDNGTWKLHRDMWSDSPMSPGER